MTGTTRYTIQAQTIGKHVFKGIGKTVPMSFKVAQRSMAFQTSGFNGLLSRREVIDFIDYGCSPEGVSGGKSHHTDLPVVINAHIHAIFIHHGQAFFVYAMASTAMRGVSYLLLRRHRITVGSEEFEWVG